eukprot:15198825-Heterocapsa_arctica.AAC.1
MLRTMRTTCISSSRTRRTLRRICGNAIVTSPRKPSSTSPPGMNWLLNLRSWTTGCTTSSAGRS